MHASWNCDAKCLASTRPSSRRKASPTTSANPAVGLAQRNQAADLAQTGPVQHIVKKDVGVLMAWWRRRARQQSRVGQCASSRGGLAVAMGMTLRACAGVRPQGGTVGDRRWPFGISELGEGVVSGRKRFSR